MSLALPRDFGADYGRGVDRGLCLGGGGLFFVAWQVAYLQTLASHGVRFDAPTGWWEPRPAPSWPPPWSAGS